MIEISEESLREAIMEGLTNSDAVSAFDADDICEAILREIKLELTGKR